MKQVISLLVSLTLAFGQGMPFPGGGLVHATGATPITLVSGQVTVEHNSADNWVVDLPSAPTNGNYVYAIVQVNYFGTDPGFTSITCTNVTGWAQVASAFVVHGSVGTANVRVWRGLAGANASASCTFVSGLGAGTDSNTILAEFAGLTGTNDGTTPVGNTGSSTAPAIGSFTNTTAASLIFVAASEGTALGFATTPGAPWTLLGTADGGGSWPSTSVSYRITTSAAAQTAAWTLNFTDPWAALVVAQH